MDTIRAKILFTELRDHLREYGGKNLKYQTRITEDAVNDLADESARCDTLLVLPLFMKRC